MFYYRLSHLNIYIFFMSRFFMILPLNCQFEITERCNEGCSYCYNAFRDDPPEDEYDSEGIARRIAENEIFYVVITGGEPFVVKDKVFRAGEVFSASNVDFSINTNLTLISRDDVKRLKDLGVVSFLTSVVSHNPEDHDVIKRRPGAFERTMKGIGLVKEQGIHLAANMVITQFNKDQVYDTGRYLHERFGDLSFCATPIMPTPGKDTELLAVSSEDYVRGLDSLLRLREDFGIGVDSLCPPLPCLFENQSKNALFLKRSCVGGRTTFTVSVDGQVRPCSHSAERYGSILDEDLVNIFPKMSKWQGSELVPEDCGDCSYEDSCRGGCRVSALAFSDDIAGKHPYFQRALESCKLTLDTENFNFSKVIQNSSGALRYRVEEGGRVTVYLSPHANAVLSQSQLDLYRIIRLRNGESLQKVKKDLRIDENFFENTVNFLERRGLIKLVGSV